MDHPPPTKPSFRFRLLEYSAIAALAIAASTCLVLALSAPADARTREDQTPDDETPDPPRLKAVIVIDHGTITLGDAFTHAGDKAGSIIAPAPAEGATLQFDAGYFVSAAKSAGLSDAVASGLTRVTVTRRRPPDPGSIPARAPGRVAGSGAAPGQKRAERMITKGELVMVRFEAPGFRIAVQGRALSDAAEGEPVRVLNLQSSRTIEATATAPGLAEAGPLAKRG